MSMVCRKTKKKRDNNVIARVPDCIKLYAIH